MTTSAVATAILGSMVTSQAPNKAMIAGETIAVAASPRAYVKYAVEAIGTFCLVFTVGAAVVTFLALNHDDK